MPNLDAGILLRGQTTTNGAGISADHPTEEVWSASTPRFWTGREIAAATPKDTEWVVEPYVPCAAVVEVDGKLKVSGKTTWVTHACACVVDGRDFMGMPTRRGPVIYLTEQTPTSWRATLGRAGLLDQDDFYCLFWGDTVGMAWPDIVRAAAAKAEAVGAELLVVDTLPQFAGLKGDAENNAGSALEAMAPVQLAAAKGLAVVVLRHERKSGGEVGDSGRGSSAFGGTVDIVLSIRRGDSKTRSTVRHLHALSRFDETPGELVIELTPDGYVALGTDTDVAAAEARAATLRAAPTSEGDALTEADLVAASDASRATARRAIEDHLQAERLARTGEAKKGNPFRYWRPSAPDEKGADQTSPPIPPERNKRNQPATGEETDMHSDQWEAVWSESSDSDDETEAHGPACLGCGVALPPGASYYCEACR